MVGRVGIGGLVHYQSTDSRLVNGTLPKSVVDSDPDPRESKPYTVDGFEQKLHIFNLELRVRKLKSN